MKDQHVTKKRCSRRCGVDQIFGLELELAVRELFTAKCCHSNALPHQHLHLSAFLLTHVLHVPWRRKTFTANEGDSHKQQ